MDMSSCKSNLRYSSRVEKTMEAARKILSAIQARESHESSLTRFNLAFQELDFVIDPNVLDLSNNQSGKVRPSSETSGSEYETAMSALSADSFQEVSTNSRIPADETGDKMYKTSTFLVLPQSRTKKFIVLPQSPGPKQNTTLRDGASESSCTGVLIMNQRKLGGDKTQKNARVLVMNNKTTEATASICDKDEGRVKNLPKQKFENAETAKNLPKQDYKNGEIPKNPPKQDYKRTPNQSSAKKRKQQPLIKPYRIFTMEVLPKMDNVSERYTEQMENESNMRENLCNAARSENNKVETMTTLRAVKNDAKVRFEDIKRIEDIEEVPEDVETIKEENVQKDIVVKKEAVTNMSKKPFEERKCLKYWSRERKYSKDRSQAKKINSVNKARIDVTDGPERLKTRKPSFHPILRKQTSTNRQPSFTRYPAAPVKPLQENKSQSADDNYTLLRTRAAQLKKKISSRPRIENTKSGKCTNLPNRTEKISDQQVTNGTNNKENVANIEKNKVIFKREKTREVKRTFRSKLRSKERESLKKAMDFLHQEAKHGAQKPIDLRMGKKTSLRRRMPNKQPH